MRWFKHTSRSPAMLASLIIEDVRLWIISKNLPSSVSSSALYRLWRDSGDCGDSPAVDCEVEEDGGQQRETAMVEFHHEPPLSTAEYGQSGDCLEATTGDVSSSTCLIGFGDGEEVVWPEKMEF
ncbi:UNVERIFIED_CONTAM: hypothetical protein Sindi_0921200 [Sesamum indicum]